MLAEWACDLYETAGSARHAFRHAEFLLTEMRKRYGVTGNVEKQHSPYAGWELSVETIESTPDPGDITLREVLGMLDAIEKPDKQASIMIFSDVSGGFYANGFDSLRNNEYQEFSSLPELLEILKGGTK